MPKGRGRLSSIHTLPEPVRVFVDDALRASQLTQAEIREQANAMLRELGSEDEISRSALNRYSMRTEEAAREVREAQEAARAIVGGLRNLPESDMGRALVEAVKTMAFRHARDVLGTGGALTPDEMAKMALTAQRLMKATASNAQWELKVQEAIKADEAAAEDDGREIYSWEGEAEDEQA